MAPEVLEGHQHSYTVDYYALGIMGYEFMIGRRPYKGSKKSEIKEQMLKKSAQISYRNIPHDWSVDAVIFLIIYYKVSLI
jgi:serine/threonine protein kinase